jgi:hypothetical protein
VQCAYFLGVGDAPLFLLGKPAAKGNPRIAAFGPRAQNVRPVQLRRLAAARDYADLMGQAARNAADLMQCLLAEPHSDSYNARTKGGFFQMPGPKKLEGGNPCSEKA